LEALGYQGVLARGFALVRDSAGVPLRSSKGVAAGERLAVEFSDGTLPVVAAGASGPRRRRGSGGGENQGNLFE
jgi:exodeoxyribonuclease VII large subunit